MPKITQIVVLDDSVRVFGLGDDSKIYEWHQNDGGSWKGYWYFPKNTTDQPSPDRKFNPAR